MGCGMSLSFGLRISGSPSGCKDGGFEDGSVVLATAFSVGCAVELAHLEAG